MFYRRSPLIQGLVILCDLNQKFITEPKNKALTKIYFMLKLCLRFYALFQVLFMALILFYACYDFNEGYRQFISFNMMIRFVLCTISLVITGFFLTSWAVFWVQLYIVVAVFHRIKLKTLREKFQCLIDDSQCELFPIKLSTTFINLGFIFNFSTGFPYFNFALNFLLRDLCRANTSMIKFSDEFKHFVGSICYIMVFSCDAFFFLMIDWRTQSFLKSVATSVFAFTTLCVLGISIIFAIPHNNLKQIVPTISEILFRNHRNQPKLMILHYQMTVNNTIGINCSGVYTITNLTNLRCLITFCLNVILILHLFREYFSSNS